MSVSELKDCAYACYCISTSTTTKKTPRVNILEGRKEGRQEDKKKNTQKDDVFPAQSHWSTFIPAEQKQSAHPSDAFTLYDILLVATIAANHDSRPRRSVSKTEELVEDFQQSHWHLSPQSMRKGW